MSGATAEQLVSAAIGMLQLDPPPSEATIDDVLGKMATAFGADAGTRDEARRLLHARFEIRMDLGQTLKSDEERVPWLAARKGSIEPFFWNRYREFLLRNGWPPLVAATLDRSTDELLDLLGNPADGGAWKRRGLVVGDVQSGKTASYAALICKAADAGYRMVILLSGTLENVRRQTQERLDAAFIGLDSRDFLAGGQAPRKKHVGVGLIDGRHDGVVFTSRDRDFRKAAASALNISLESVSAPVLVVSKKNKTILGRLAGWLRAKNADRAGKIDLPLLLIDDEADNASINTRQDPNETTAINRAIRDLLGLFKRSSYVGFTATPFANIFVDPASTDEMLGDDLFPGDFIHVLEAPGNHVGLNAVFPAADPEELGDHAGDTMSSQSDFLRSIDDGEDWLPATHKKDFEPGPLPESLRFALRSFLVSCAIRDLRAVHGADGRGGGLHRSMLVNVSWFTAVQNRVADALHLELEEMRRAVRLYGARPPDTAAADSREIAALAQTFEREFRDCGCSWAAVLGKLHEAISPVRVQAVNQGTGAASLDYSVTDQAPGVRVIAVGGNSLSRGLTIEGLSISYFLRNTRAYDTLVQMGRWFGYRDGYRDLCRLWLTDEAQGWYRHVAVATAELRRDFARMRRRQATPREFGMRVRTHPGTLLITARNKMATGEDVALARDISPMGRMIESSRLYSDRRRNEENLRLIQRFLGQLVSQCGGPGASPHGGAVLWREVPGGIVADLLDNFLVHPMNFDFQGDSIAEFLRRAAAESDPLLSTWTVVLPTRGEENPVALAALPGVAVSTRKRRVAIRHGDDSLLGGSSLLVSGKSARVGGRADVRHGFSPDDLRAASEGKHDVPEDTLRAAMKAPLLIVYLLRGVERVPDGERFREEPYRDGLILPALGLHFPGPRDSDAPRHLVHYRLNRVAQGELLPPGAEGGEESGDADADD